MLCVFNLKEKADTKASSSKNLKNLIKGEITRFFLLKKEIRNHRNKIQVRDKKEDLEIMG